MLTGFVYNERLNLLNWKGCSDLWRHKGMDAERRVPHGFHTVGVPGVLASTSIPGPITVDPKRLDDLVRGYVGDRWDADDSSQEFDPIFILQQESSKMIQVVAEGYKSWLVDDEDYGWVEFKDKYGAIAWVKGHS